MPNNATTNVVEIEEEYNEESDFGRDDYGFIIGPDGDLKSIIMPEHLMEDPPEEIKLILSIFGIDNIHELENKPLH